MGITVSTSAFDAVLEERPGFCVWLAKGFVSGGVCGFDLFLDANLEARDVLVHFMSEIMLWGADGTESSLQLELTQDGKPVELTLAAGGASGGEGEGAVSARLSVEFPTPAGSSAVVLTTSSPAWGHRAAVAFDPRGLALDLERWRAAAGTQAVPGVAP